MQIFNQQSRMKKIIGLRNIVTNGRKWKYLIFYDVDNPSEGDIKNIIDFMEQSQVSYIIYSTKHGIHVIGLTPLNAMKWASMHNGLLGLVPEYFSGQTIRLSLKEGEKQSLVFWNFDYPVLMNLFGIYSKRFKFATTPQCREHKVMSEYIDWVNHGTKPEWHLVFEKYWSKKI